MATNYYAVTKCEDCTHVDPLIEEVHHHEHIGKTSAAGLEDPSDVNSKVKMAFTWAMDPARFYRRIAVGEIEVIQDEYGHLHDVKQFMKRMENGHYEQSFDFVGTEFS